jgi:hypothetical protein
MIPLQLCVAPCSLRLCVSALSFVFLFSLFLSAIAVCHLHRHSVMFTSSDEPRYFMTTLPDANPLPSAFDAHHPPSKQIIENCVHCGY